MRADRQLGRLRARVARFVVSLAAFLLLGLCATAPASAQVSFTGAWGWGVRDGKQQFEKCTKTCEAGLSGAGAGELDSPFDDAVDGSGDVFVADTDNDRVNEFSSSGKFIKAWGWGVRDGKQQLETCAKTCEAGLSGGGAGQLDGPEGVAVDGSGDVFVTNTGNSRIEEFSSTGKFIKAWGGVGGLAGQLIFAAGVAVDGSGDVFVADLGNDRVDEFSSAGKFVKAWGWGVRDDKQQFETCTKACETGNAGGGAGQLNAPEGVAVDGSGDVFVADYNNDRVDEFSSAGKFIKAWGWGVRDGKQQLETCAKTCEAGLSGGGAGQLLDPFGVAVNGSGDVFVTDNDRVDEFSSSGKFIKGWGWGVRDGKSHLETCTTATSCFSGLFGGGAGQLNGPEGVAVDGSGNVFVVDSNNNRVDEFGGTLPVVPVVYAGYADGYRKGAVRAPSPWKGSPGVIFEGCNYFNPDRCPKNKSGADGYDSGAIRIDNTSAQKLTVTNASVVIGSCTFHPWSGLKVALPAGRQLILTQTGGRPPCPNTNDKLNFDTSDTDPNHGCVNDHLIPRLHVTIDGSAESFHDNDRILNTGGVDLGSKACGDHNESHSWGKMTPPT